MRLGMNALRSTFTRFSPRFHTKQTIYTVRQNWRIVLKGRLKKKWNSSPTNHLNIWDFDLNLQIIRATVIGPFGDFGRKSDERAMKSFHWNGSSSFINVDKITCSHYKQHIEQCSKPTSVIQKCVGYSFGRKNVDSCTFAYIHKLKYQEIMTWVHNDLLWKRKFYFVTQLWSTGWKNRMLQQVLKLGHFESTISIEMCVCVMVKCEFTEVL